MDNRKKYEEDIDLEIIQEEDLTIKDIDSALEQMAEWLIDNWLKKNNADILSDGDQTT